MMRCGDSALAYVVVSTGGVGGVGERLCALRPDEVRFSHNAASCDLAPEDLAKRPELTPGAWPIALDRGLVSG